MDSTKVIKAQENQTFADISIKYTGTADNDFTIASLNNMSVSDFIPAGTDIIVPIPSENNAIIKTEENTNTELSLAGVFGSLLKHCKAIASNLGLGHVRGGGNVRIDSEGRMWVEIPEYRAKEKRFACVSNVCYCGTAIAGTIESSITWNLTKIAVAADGTTTVTHTTNSWINFLTANYI